MRKVLLLGASGSIGTQSLDVLSRDRTHFSLTGFSLGKRVEKIPSILAAFPEVTHICVRREEDCRALQSQYPSIAFHFGDQGLLDLIEQCPSDLVENALVGFAGMMPSLKALQENKILCLANKESLVVGGSLIQEELSAGHGKLYPIDSEHVAIAKLLSRVRFEDVDKILITASGGSFRNKAREELASVTAEDALKHPTWSMGAKITIDSATMMNKGFEVIEAMRLFDVGPEKIEILLHDESHVHSLLLLKDGSYLADVSAPDMRGPIAYALYETKIDFDLVHAKSLAEIGPYHFHAFDPSRYPAVGIALESYRRGGSATAVLNAANEEAVYAFLDGKIPFLSIEPLVQEAVDALPILEHPTASDLVAVDRKARSYVRSAIERRAL